MATFPKISDSEMNYFQFKARQLLLLKKEDEEWQEYYLKQSDPGCSVCSKEMKDVTKECKTVAVQVSSKKPFVLSERKSVHLEHQDDKLPQALHNISVKLANINLALSKMHEVSKKNEMDEAKPLPINAHQNVQTLKPLADQRKYLIQKSLKASLQKIHLSPPRKPKQIQARNCGYFLPHDLQQKRAVARRVYLASLQNKKNNPEIPEKVKHTSKREVPSNKTKKDLSKVPIKPRKKVSSKSNIEKHKTKVEKAKDEPTLVEAVEADEQKDENIEYAVDGILDDLLREAVVDLNRIKQRGTKKQCISSHFEKNEKDKEHSTSQDILNSQVTTTVPKILAENFDSIRKIKQFFDSPEKSYKKNEDESKEYSVHDHDVSQKNNSEQLSQKSDAKKPFFNMHPKTSYEIKNPPKFVCGISKIISVDPEKIKNIALQKDRFWKYLSEISRTIKGNFNPWLFCNTIAESILDDCIKDVADELGDVPSVLIKEIYDKEFMQNVEFHSKKQMDTGYSLDLKY